MRKTILIIGLLVLAIALSGCTKPAPASDSVENIIFTAEDVASDGFVQFNPSGVEIGFDSAGNFQNFFRISETGVVLSEYVSFLPNNAQAEFDAWKTESLTDKIPEWINIPMGEDSVTYKFEGTVNPMYELDFVKQDFFVMVGVTNCDDEEAEELLRKYGKMIESRIK